MPVETAADRRAFLDTDAFGLPFSIQHVHVAVAPYVLNGIFEDGYQQIELADGSIVSAREVRLLIAEDDLQSDLRKGDVINGSWRVQIVEPDGTGMISAVLESLAPIS